QKSLLYHPKSLITWLIPYFLIDDFHLDGTTITRLLNRLSDATNINEPISHHTASLKNIWNRNNPIRHMESENTPFCMLDLPVKVRIPPHVEYNDKDTRLMWGKFFRQTVRFIQCHNDRTIRGIHRMKRRNTQFDTM